MPRRRSTASPAGSGRSSATARERGAYVHVDMEQYAHKDLTYASSARSWRSPSSATGPTSGSWPRRTCPRPRTSCGCSGDWVEPRGTPVTVRLVKGAYWDYEVVHARQLGWPEPVYLEKWQTRRRRSSVAPGSCWSTTSGCGRPSAATTSGACAHAIAAAEAMGVPRDGLRAPDAPRHGRADPARAGRPRPPGPGLHARMARCCRAWPTWSAGCWKTRRTSRS